MDLKTFCAEKGIPIEELGPIGAVSDGFHTFDSLYHQRLILFASLVNAFPTLSWKSHKHSDGEAPFGGGWFIVGITTPKGAYTYHYENKDWDLFRCEEIEKAPKWDGHTDKDVGRLLSLTDEPVDWAGREVLLACASERESVNQIEDATDGINCYESALRAYRCLTRDGLDGFGLQITKSILNRLIDGKCLTPIADTPDIWEELAFEKESTTKSYQCRRMSSLFKEVAADGTVTYKDIDRVQAVDVDNPDIPYTNGFVTRLIDKIFPITMPYLPDSKKFKVVRETFLTDPKNGDYDTVAYLYVITPSGEKVELNGYFKDGKNGMVRIDKAEYDERKARRVEKK